MIVTDLVTRSFGIARGAARGGFRLARWGARTAQGQVQRMTQGSSAPKPDMDDATLKAKVETELFRPADSPKGTISITVVNGIVQLRGTVKRPDEINGVEARVQEIPEVRGVENLLHLPNTPAPTRTDSPNATRKRAARSGGGSASEA